MKTAGNRTVQQDQRRLDRVVIEAAVAALFGPHAVVRHAIPAAESAASTWMREGRLEIQTSHRMSRPLIRSGPDRRRSTV